MRTILALAALLAAPASFAAPKVDAARIGVACKDDFKKLCKDSGGGSMLECMEKHRAEVGEPCRAAMDEGKTAAPAAGAKRPKSCKDEFVRVCKGVKSSAFKACLKERRTQLSDFCRMMVDGTK